MNSNIPKENLNKEKFFQKKWAKPACIALALILIALIGAFIYIKVNFTAQGFLNKETNSLIKYLDNALEKLNLDSEYLNNYLSYDVESNGNVKINTDKKDITFLNNLNLDYKLNVSFEKEYENLNFTLKNEQEKALTADLIINKDKLYVDSKDIYQTALSTSLDDNYFEKITSGNKDKISALTPKNIKYILLNGIKYYKESLSEADICEKALGLTKYKYTYQITDKNKDKVREKFINLIKNDKTFKEVLDAFDITDYEDIAESLIPDDLTVTVEVNVLNGSIENFTITSDENTLTGNKISEDKYKISSENNYLEITKTNKGYEITIFEENEKTGSLTIINNKDFKIKYEDENGNYGKLSVVTNKKKSNITLTMKNDEDTFDIKIDNTVNEKNKTVQSNITANVLYEKNTYKIEISNDSKYGNNLVNTKTFTDAKDFEELSDDDYMEVYTNVQNIISKLGISNTEL